LRFPKGFLGKQPPQSHEFAKSQYPKLYAEIQKHVTAIKKGDNSEETKMAMNKAVMEMQKLKGFPKGAGKGNNHENGRSIVKQESQETKLYENSFSPNEGCEPTNGNGEKKLKRLRRVATGGFQLEGEDEKVESPGSSKKSSKAEKKKKKKKKSKEGENEEAAEPMEEEGDEQTKPSGSKTKKAKKGDEEEEGGEKTRTKRKKDKKADEEEEGNDNKAKTSNVGYRLVWGGPPPNKFWIQNSVKKPRYRVRNTVKSKKNDRFKLISIYFQLISIYFELISIYFQLISIYFELISIYFQLI